MLLAGGPGIRAPPPPSPVNIFRQRHMLEKGAKNCITNVGRNAVCRLNSSTRYHSPGRESGQDGMSALTACRFL